MPRKKETIPANETPAQKFVRLATQRTQRIIDTYKQLGSLAGSAYQSTPEQVKKISEALKAEHDRAIDSLNKKKVETGGFKL